MTEPGQTPDVSDGTDITVDPEQIDANDETPATSDAEAFREEGDTLGGTGGIDAGGAG